MIRVVLIDDEKLFVQSLCLRVNNEDDMEVVGIGTSIEEVLPLCSQYKPDVLLLDIYIKDKMGTDIIKEIKMKFNELKILLLTSNANNENVALGIAEGADGITSKDIESDKFVRVIRNTYTGLHFFDQYVFEIIREYFSKEMELQQLVSDKATLVDLSATELEIVKHISQGKNNSQIANDLCYSKGTIKNYVSKIMKKLDTSDRTGIALYALKNDLI